MSHFHRGATTVVLLFLAGAGSTALAVRGLDDASLADTAPRLTGLRWAAELPAAALTARTSEGAIFVLTVTDELHVLDLHTGRTIWSRSSPQDSALVLIRGDEALVAGSRELRCWDRQTGRFLWARVWPGSVRAPDALAVDASGSGWLVRSVGQHRFAERLDAEGSSVWSVGPSVGGYPLAYGLLFTLGPEGQLVGRSPDSGRVAWSTQLPAGRYRLGPDGGILEMSTGHLALQIGPGPSLAPAAPVVGADPTAVPQGPVICDQLGCLVQLPSGWRWFEGLVQLLPQELRVIRAASGAGGCVGCLSMPQAPLLRVESWSRDGTALRRWAVVRKLGVYEDPLGFVELAGRWVVATAWQE